MTTEEITKLARSLCATSNPTMDDVWFIEDIIEGILRTHCIVSRENVREAEEVTIDREEYEQLCKYRRYFSNWGLNRVECVHCGEINPDGYMCATCGKDPKH